MTAPVPIRPLDLGLGFGLGVDNYWLFIGSHLNDEKYPHIFPPSRNIILNNICTIPRNFVVWKSIYLQVAKYYFLTFNVRFKDVNRNEHDTFYLFGNQRTLKADLESKHTAIWLCHAVGA